MNFGDVKDGAANIKSFYGGSAAATAGSTGDNTESNGQWIDRQGASWAKVLVGYEAVLGIGATLAIAANLQEATDDAGTGAADFGDALASAVQATGQSGGEAVSGVVELHFDLTEAERYIRIQSTPNLSAANTDTARVTTMIVLGGYQNLPASVPAN